MELCDNAEECRLLLIILHLLGSINHTNTLAVLQSTEILSSPIQMTSSLPPAVDPDFTTSK